MSAHIKFNQEYNVQLLKSELNLAMAIDWKDHFNTNDYTGSWQSISLQSESGREDDIYSNYGVACYKETSLLKKLPYIKSILDSWLCSKESIRLLALHPGAEIKPHRDLGCNYSNGACRIHIPIQTNKHVQFRVGGENLILNEGTSWYIDFDKTHSITNNGKTVRVHLVIDCLRNEWTDKLFSTHGYDLDADNRPPVYDDNTIKLMIAELERMDTDTARDMILKLKKQQ